MLYSHSVDTVFGIVNMVATGLATGDELIEETIEIGENLVLGLKCGWGFRHRCAATSWLHQGQPDRRQP